MTERGKRPHSKSTLDRWVHEFASEHDLVQKRVRDWVSYMILASKLEASALDQRATFVIKGGVALEMRLRDRARATEDLDLIFADPNTDGMVSALRDALRGSFQDFTFRVKGEPHPMDGGTVRLEVAIEYRERGWGTVQVDLSPRENHELEQERVSAISLGVFGLEVRKDLPCLSIRYHLAHKIHGMTEPGANEEPNLRVRDLVDLFLLRELAGDTARARIREACVEVFEGRGKHAWPPEFSPPDFWKGEFESVAQRLGLPITAFEKAVEEARTYIQGIQATG